MPSVVEPVISARIHLTAAQPVIAVPAATAVLRPWRPADALQLRNALSDPQIQKWNLHKFNSIKEARNWVLHWSQRWRRGTGGSWAIVDAVERDRVLGQVAFRSLYLADGLAELSCWVVPDARRRHLGTEATRELATWAIDTLGLERLEIVHSVHNPASCPVALRAGFRIEGVKRRLQQHEDGFHDMCLHSRIRGDDGKPIVDEPVEAPPRRIAVRATAVVRRLAKVILDR